jgi:hypothetical protein
VPSRVSPTEKIRGEIDALFGSGRDLSEVLEDVARLGARLIMQAAVEAEVAEFLGRARYQRRAETPDARPGSRNGYCPTTVKTTAGPVTLLRPKLRGTDEKFVSRLFGAGVSKTNALETLVIAGFVRGLSVRDVEAALADALGPQAALSKSTVSRVCQAIRDEFDAWRVRRLDDLELDYLFVDGSHFKMHAGSRAEPVLAAWGITTAGKPVLIGLEAARRAAMLNLGAYRPGFDRAPGWVNGSVIAFFGIVADPTGCSSRAAGEEPLREATRLATTSPRGPASTCASLPAASASSAARRHRSSAVSARWRQSPSRTASAQRETSARTDR